MERARINAKKLNYFTFAVKLVRQLTLDTAAFQQLRRKKKQKKIKKKKKIKM